ncbi:MAG: M14 family zinc carboxypeptidase [Flavobacteriales bacterium]
MAKQANESRLLIGCLILLSLNTAGVSAQQELPTPSEFLGFELGSRFSLHHQVDDYVEYLASESESQGNSGIISMAYGQTEEGRPLKTLVFTHPELSNQLEDIRLQHLDRMNGGTGNASFDEIAIVWLSYNVHGNEAVCTEAALEVMHELAERCMRGDEMMKKLVVIVDPCLNPDGHDRYAFWFNQYASLEPNGHPDAIEHDEPWPGGRPNHYLFDLNRDWAWQTQIESRARSALYHQWMPHVHCDYHEMGYNSPYYFAPAAEPYHEAITDWQREFQNEIGDAAAAAFDDRGELYFTRESFDLLYPSYGDTYPIYNGAIGMTYEQGGSGSAGVLIQRNDGTQLSLRNRIDNHVVSSISAVETSARLSSRLVNEFAEFHEANRTKPSGRFGGYLIPVNKSNAARVNRLVTFLNRHQIECEKVTAQKSTSGWAYGLNQNQSVNAKPGDLFISSYQTHSRILDVLFDPDPVLTDSATYDITTWSVPYAYGLTAYGLSKPVGGSPWKIESTSQPFVPNADSFGFAIAPDQEYYSAFLAACLKEGLRFRTNSKAIVHKTQSFAPGTLFLLKGDQKEEVNWQEQFTEKVAAFDVRVEEVLGGHAVSGPDMGSDDVWLVEAPKVAMVMGEQISSLGAGEVWWHFEHELNYPITRLAGTSTDPSDWDEWDVVILPSGWYRFMDSDWKSSLSSWLRGGGRVIAIAGALNSFANDSDWGLDRLNSTSNDENDDDASYANRNSQYASTIGDGSIYAVDLDLSHPLAWGYPEQPYYSLRSSGAQFAPLNSGWSVGRFSNSNRPVSGFVGSRANQEIAGSLAFGTHSVGRGEMIYFVDNPLFRGFWENGKRLIDNAVFMPMD